MFDLATFIQTIGYLGLLAIVFAESGLLIGFFLPGDSLLFTAGFLASQDLFSLPLIILGCFVAAVTGDSVGYAFGQKVGPKIFTREDSLFFDKRHIFRAREFYARHGAKTIVLARFVPFVRTFAPILAGVGTMDYPTFLVYNLIGGALWAIGLPYLGFTLGNLIPNIDRYLLPIVAAIIIISVLPNVIHIMRDPMHRKQIANWLKKS